MLEYTKIEPPIEITATGNDVLRGTAQGILLLLVEVGGTDDVLKTVKLPFVLVPGLKNICSPLRLQLKKAFKQS